MRAAILAMLLAAVMGGQPLPNRWYYLSRNFSTDAHVDDFRSLAENAAAHGYTGVVLDAQFDSIDRASERVRGRLLAARAIAAQNGIEIIPLFCSPGYAGGLLAHNRNLAEGLPVRGAPFVVRGGEATLEPNSAVKTVNGGFEEFNGNVPLGYRFTDSPGDISFIDTAVFHSGQASLRFENFAGRMARASQEIPVAPYRSYRVTAWLKTESVEPAAALLVQVLGTDGRTLAPFSAGVPSTTDWRKVVFGFNSLGYERIRLYVGAWGGRGGRFWVDDLEVEEVGMVNVVRRPGTPLRVANENTGAVYQEGVDFEPVADPQLDFKFTHEAPAVKLTPQTLIREGERLRVSWYHAMSINNGQVSACMSEPELLEIAAENTRLIHELLSPSKWMLSIDEIRAGGSCEACRRRGGGMAAILGEFVTHVMRAIYAQNSEAVVYAWSDMLDPNHNAHGSYYLVDGDFAGSWEHVPPDLRIVCWHYALRRESLDFFSKRGFRTVAGAYYDGDDLSNPAGWLDALRDTPGAEGILYTTWQNKYDLLAAFGDLVSGTAPPEARSQKCPETGAAPRFARAVGNDHRLRRSVP
jgi:hypothetical protein